MNRREVIMAAVAAPLAAALLPAAAADEWHVYRLTDYEWYMGRTLEEAEQAAFENWGCGDLETATEDGLYDREDAYELDGAQLDRHRFIDSDEDERPIGEPRSFRHELARRIAAGPRAELFAATDW